MFRKDKNSNIFRPDFFLFAFSKRDANFWERPPRILLCPVSKKTNLKIEKAKKNTIQECLTLLMFVGECNRRSTNRWQFNQPFDLAPASACWLLVNCLPDSKTTSTSTPTCCASRSRTRINRSLLARPQLSAFTFSCTFCFSQKQMRTCPLPLVVFSLYFDFFSVGVANSLLLFNCPKQPRQLRAWSVCHPGLGCPKPGLYHLANLPEFR